MMSSLWTSWMVNCTFSCILPSQCCVLKSPSLFKGNWAHGVLAPLPVALPVTMSYRIHLGFRSGRFIIYHLSLSLSSSSSSSMLGWRWASGVMVAWGGCGALGVWRGRWQPAEVVVVVVVVGAAALEGWACGTRPWRTRAATVAWASRTAAAAPHLGTCVCVLYGLVSL